MLILESNTGAKFTVEFKMRKPISKDRVLLKFLKPGEDGWMYYVPNIVFNNVCDLIKHLKENVETDDIHFVVSNLESKI